MHGIKNTTPQEVKCFVEFFWDELYIWWHLPCVTHFGVLLFIEEVQKPVKSEG